MKVVEGYPEYLIADDGKVFREGKEVRPWRNFNGYWRVSLSRNKVKKNLYVHRLVAEAYVPNPQHLPEVNHLDEDKNNNHYLNLEWVSSADNKKYSFTGRTYVKVPSSDRVMIKRLKTDGLSIPQIARRLNLKGITVQSILRQ